MLLRDGFDQLIVRQPAPRPSAQRASQAHEDRGKAGAPFPKAGLPLGFEVAVPPALFQGVLNRPNGIAVGAAGLWGLKAHLDDDEVCWNRAGNAELVPEGWEDDV